MNDVDPRAVAALAEQLEHRRARLREGASHVGWKLGMGDRERIGGELAVGHLTSATVLGPGGGYRSRGEAAGLHADAELLVRLGRDVDASDGARAAGEAIAGYGPALEIVDLAPLPNEPRAVVAGNVFHRAVVLGEVHAALPAVTEAKLLVNGELRASAHTPHDLPERLLAAARLLAAVGQRLRAGDRIITGSIVQVGIRVGDELVADFGPLGAARAVVSA